MLSLLVFLAPLSHPRFAQSAEQGGYLVIVAPGVEDVLQPWQKHRESQGFTVKVVRSTDIIAGSSGIAPYIQVQNYVRDNQKKFNIKYLLLVGDTNDVPMPRLYAAKNVDNVVWGEPGPVYSDYFYSQPDTNWDRDSDGRLGEPEDDQVLIAPKIAVGRIPFSDQGNIEKYLNRVKIYDSPSASRKNVLQAAAIYSFDNEDGDPTNKFTDGADMEERIWNDILKPMKYIRKTLYECDGTKPGLPGDMCLNSTNLINELTKNDYGIVNWLAHGETNRIVRKYWLNDQDGNGHADSNTEIRMPLLLDDGQLYNNIIKSRLIISTACSTADIAGGASSLGSASLRSGAGAFIGATAINYFTPGWSKPSDGGNQTISYNITKNYAEGDAVGFALAKSLESFAKEFRTVNGWQEKYLQNVYSFILLGDPGMKQEPVIPKQDIQMAFFPASITVVSGQKAETKLVFGEVPAIYPLKLSYTTIYGITITFDPPDPLPNQDARVIVQVEKFVVPQKVIVTVKGESQQYKGQAELEIVVKAPPPTVTELVLLPEYTYAKQGQELWIDLLVSPSLPVDSLSAQLEYDNEKLQFQKMRVGQFATLDYRCCEAPNSIQSRGRIIFSFARNFEKYGISSPGIAFSFCFQGRKQGASNISLTLATVKSPDSSVHLLSDLPVCRINIDQNGFSLQASIADGQNIKGDIVTVSGNSSREQVLVVENQNEKYIPRLTSEGSYSTDINLGTHSSDVLFKVEDSSYGRSLWIRRMINRTDLRELAFHIDDRKAWNNGNCEELEASPFIVNGKTLVPLRYIAEKLGYQTKWLASEQRIDLLRGQNIITMWVGKKNAYVNGQPYQLDATPQIRAGRTFVPLRFVADAINCDVKWDQATRTAIVRAETT